METIKCKVCGQVMGAGSEVCPVCGTPVNGTNRLQETMQEHELQKDEKAFVSDSDELYGTYAPKQGKKGKTWIVFAALLVVLAVGVAVYFGMSDKSDKADTAFINDSVEVEEAEGGVSAKINILADGEYCYKGNWDSEKYTASPCKMEFEKKNNTLRNCAYTNLKYDTRIPLDGTIENSRLHFIGKVNGKQLVIDLEVSADGNTLNGKGVDYAHKGDEAKLFLEKADTSFDEVSSGLTFRTFTKGFTETGTGSNVVVQIRLSNEQVVRSLKSLGFELVKSETKSRYNHIDEVYYDAAIDTYTKTVNGNTTTVIYDEAGSTKIIFPTFDEAKAFEKTIKECGLQKGDGGYEDAKEIYWVGTDVYIDGKTVILHYKSES